MTRKNSKSFNRRAFLSLIGAGLVAGGLTTAQNPAQAAIKPATSITIENIQRIVVAEALQDGVVPPALALAVARVESNFRADVTSHAGARGVMQIMPATAAGEFGVGADQLFDARLNARLGIAFLHQLRNRYDNRWDLALSHYNGGSLNKSHGQWVPHDYTSKYVSDVMRFWNSFQREHWVLAMVNETRALHQLAQAKPQVNTTAQTSSTQARMAADYAYLEDPQIDHGWRDYLQVADRWLQPGTSTEAGSAPVSPVDFAPSVSGDPNWHYPLTRPSSATVAAITGDLKGADRFIFSGRFWRNTAGKAVFN